MPHLTILYLIWLFTTTIDYQLPNLPFDYLLPHFISVTSIYYLLPHWLSVISLTICYLIDYLLPHLTIHYLIWLFINSFDYLLPHLTIYYLIWQSVTSYYYLRPHLSIYYLIWLFHEKTAWLDTLSLSRAATTSREWTSIVNKASRVFLIMNDQYNFLEIKLSI